MAVRDAAGVGGGNGGADLRGDPGRPGGRHRAAFTQHVAEVGAVDQLHDHERRLARPLQRVHRRHVGVVEPGDRPDLALEPVQERLVTRERRDRDLDGDTAGPQPVPGLQHRRGRAAADRPDDLVAVAERAQVHQRERPPSRKPNGGRSQPPW
jgi:hypothetical protein